MPRQMIVLRLIRAPGSASSNSTVVDPGGGGGGGGGVSMETPFGTPKFFFTE